MIGPEAKGGVSPHKEDNINPFRLATSASPAKLSSPSTYSRTHSHTPSGEAIVSVTCDILHGSPNMDSSVCVNFSSAASSLSQG